MSKSNGRKKPPPRRKPARRHVSPGLGGYVPELLSDSTDLTMNRLAAMPVSLLPTLGLAEVYLGSTPVRAANQCSLACLVIMTSLIGFGIHPEIVAASVEVRNADGGITRYGDQAPEFTATEGTLGHTVLIADGKFVDPTGGQFPEIAKLAGVRALGGDLQGRADAVLSAGAVVPMRLAAEAVEDDGPVHVLYRLGPRGSADEATSGFLHQEHAHDDVAALSSNLTLLFCKLLSVMPYQLGELARVPQYRRIVEKARGLRGREIGFDAGGLAYVVP